jgi:hypothetical protein
VSKINNDKYYTSKELSKYCIDKTFQIIGKENITEIIEPSAGNGSFSDQIECIAYDIEPESDYIIKQDFLQLDIEYKKGRLIIGNPPYGSKMQLAIKFFKKSIKFCDYISFILPISQLNNTISLYEFDLIYSEDLGIKKYSNKNIYCVLNIYRRPDNGLNCKQKFEMNDIKIVRDAKKGYDDIEDYDIRMVYWGSGCAGKILNKDDKRYAGEYKIKIYNDKLRSKIIETLSITDWKKELKTIAMLKIKQYHIYNLLKREVPEIS